MAFNVFKQNWQIKSDFDASERLIAVNGIEAWRVIAESGTMFLHERLGKRLKKVDNHSRAFELLSFAPLHNFENKLWLNKFQYNTG